MAFTVVAGRTLCLGPYGSVQSPWRHARIVREAATDPANAAQFVTKVEPAAPTVAAAAAAFWAHAKVTYARDASGWYLRKF